MRGWGTRGRVTEGAVQLCPCPSWNFRDKTCSRLNDDYSIGYTREATPTPTPRTFQIVSRSLGTTIRKCGLNFFRSLLKLRTFEYTFPCRSSRSSGRTSKSGAQIGIKTPRRKAEKTRATKRRGGGGGGGRGAYLARLTDLGIDLKRIIRKKQKPLLVTPSADCRAKAGGAIRYISGPANSFPRPFCFPPKVISTTTTPSARVEHPPSSSSRKKNIPPPPPSLPIQAV